MVPGVPQALFFVIELWLVKPGLYQDLIIVPLLRLESVVSLRTMGAMVLFRRSVLDRTLQTLIMVETWTMIWVFYFLPSENSNIYYSTSGAQIPVVE